MYQNNRGEKGSLGDSEKFVQDIKWKSKFDLDPNKQLIIYYYPGNDPCNSGRAATLKSKI